MAFEVVYQLPLVLLNLCWGCFTVEVVSLPEFEPNEYLFTTHADKGNDRWEIYAWAIRDILCKEGDFKPTDMPLKLKQEYELYLKGDTPDALHPKQVYIDYIKQLNALSDIETGPSHANLNHDDEIKEDFTSNGKVKDISHEGGTDRQTANEAASPIDQKRSIDMACPPPEIELQ